jgi:hypothetical protein
LDLLSGKRPNLGLPKNRLFYIGWILAAVISAILFRAQVENLRITLSAKLVLIFWESVLLLAMRIANPVWASSLE